VKVTTTRSKPKPFSWSYSKLKNFRTCPWRHYNVEVVKSVKEAEGESLRYGNTLHDVFAKRLRDKAPFPAGFSQFEAAAQRIEAAPGTLMVEQKLAIRRDFSACGWFADDAWFRAIADVAVISPPVAVAIDFKTGRILEDSEQLSLMAACVFAHWPDVHAVRTEFWWLKDDAVTRCDIRRSDLAQIWSGVMPAVQELQLAYETNNFPPKSSGLCKRHCPVSGCKFHGK
jgi:hypothetical protein